MVPRVVDFGAELKTHGLANGEVLDRREVPACPSIAADAAEEQREGSQVLIQLLTRHAIEAGVHIEPLAHVALVLGERNVLDIAIEDGVAEAERSARLAKHDSVQLPAAGHELRGAGK